MPVIRYNPAFWYPDKGEIDNDGWLEVKNVLPYAGGWLVDSAMTRRSIFTAAGGDTDIRGMAIHSANGTNDWLIYVGTDTELFTVEPATWASPTSRGSGYTVDSTNGWSFTPHGSNMVAVAGHSQSALVRVDDTGSFVDLITNAQPDLTGFAKVWQYEDAPATYVDITDDINDPGASDAQVFPDTPQVNDAIYFGRFNGLPADLHIKLGTPGVPGAGTFTVIWEYYDDGGSWTSLSGVTDNTSGFTAAAGVYTVVYTSPTDAGELELNLSASLYWIRARISVIDNPMTTVPKITQVGEYTAWPPQPKFVANWGEAVAIANYANVGPADEYGDPNPNGIWISDRTGRTFGTYTTHPGERTTYLSLNDNYGDISGLVSGGEFGAVLKPTAIYRVTFGGPFRVDIRVSSSAVGSIFPNSWVWANQHELYGMTSGGPAVMTSGGIELLGTEQWQRTLFDDSWLVDTFAMNPSQSARYLCYATYSRATDIVTWFYRSTTDAMDTQINYHRKTGRASVCERDNMILSGTGRSSQVYAAAVAPLAEATRFSGLKDVFILATDPTNANGDVAIFEPNAAGAYKWQSKPYFSTPFLELGQLRDGSPGKARIAWVRPLYSLNTGGTAPTITVKVRGKDKSGEAADSSNDSSTTTEDQYGRFLQSNSRLTMLQQMQITFGNADVDNIEDLAEILDRIDIGVIMGGALDA